MSYNGSGTFVINTAGQPVVTGTPISSTVFNALTADLATGLSTAITKDGQTATTARIPFAAGINSTLVTDSTSTTTGSIITAGGAGVAKALFVGTTANVAGAVTLQSTLGVTGITTFSAQPIFSSLTASSAVATDASKGLVSVTNTGTGNNVLATSPTLVTPVLGAASATSVTVAAGAVGTPSITTAGDTNTGIFFPAADTIAFAEGGVEAVRIDSDGDVGIGTSSPSNALVVTRPLNTAVNLQIVQTGLEAWTVGMAANSSALAFSNSGTERARFNTTGALVFAGGTTTANGIGITFPATQSASSDANTLDDYEEGTWTPNQGSGLTVIGAFSSSGRYTKIGRVVYVSGRVQGATSVATTAGTIMFTNIPFTIADLTATGVIVNDALNTFGGVGAFNNTAYSTTTMASSTVIDFSFTLSV